MLDLKKDSLDYGEELKPPADYELAFAVGTTYSLDLNALMLLPVALFFSRPLEVSSGEIRVEILEAVQRVSERIHIFCQAGKKIIPARYSCLMAYWEKSIHEIRMGNYYSSFHPKMWLARYEATKDKTKPAIYRLLVTSRNLTFASDFDVAIVTQGEVGKRKTGRNRALKDFMDYLKATDSSLVWPDCFTKDLERTGFDLPGGFEEMEFMPVSISKDYPNPLWHTEWKQLFIVSPFLDATTLQKISKQVSGKRYLLSGRSELDKIDPVVLREYECYQLSSGIEEGADCEQLDESVAVVNQQRSAVQLHAKMYIGSTRDQNVCLLGSANCSVPAMERNIECLVKLTGTKKGQGLSRLLSQFKGEHGEPLFMEEYKPGDCLPTEDKEQQLRKLLYELTGLNIQGELVERDNRLYEIHLTADLTGISLPEEAQVEIALLSDMKRRKKLRQGEKVVFDKPYSVIELTPYLVLTVVKEAEEIMSVMLRMDIQLPEDRLNRILTHLISTQDKFLAYISFLLDENSVETEVTGWEENGDEEGEGGKGTALVGCPLYERFLIAASRQPQKLEKVGQLVDRIRQEQDNAEESVIPDEFIEFWKKFEQYYTTGNHGKK